MFGRVSSAFVLGLTVTLLVPTSSAWNVHASEPSGLELRAWTQWAQLGGGTDLPGDLRPAVGCALGDVNGDGAGDLLTRVHDPTSNVDRLRALAGPDFSGTIWQLASKGQRVMHCAPDLNLDGASDPVTSIASQTSGSTTGPQAVDRASQVLDGASGNALLRRQHQDTQTSAGSGGVAANSTATTHLLPAAAGAEALVKTGVQQSALSGLPSSLPVSSLTATARRAAELQLLDAQGTVQAVIRVDTPGVDPLAMAPLPVGLGLPDVAVLTAKTTSPLEEASQRIPTLNRFNPDGSLAWAVELEPTQGLPVLVPRAGDLNLDGVEDLIVETVPMGLQAAPVSQFTVLSGIDGTPLLESGPPAMGMVAALPLGSLPSGEPAILSAVQPAADAPTTLRALKAGGGAAWSVDVEPGSFPVNVLTDSYTGDPVGFSDLTGDGIPDVGVAARKGSDWVLQAVNGADGAIVWTRTLTNVERILPIPPRDTLGKLTTVGVAHPSDLLVIGDVKQAPNLTLIQSTTGDVAWRLTGPMPSGAAHVEAAVQAAGDLNRDGVQDLLLTLDPAGARPDESVYAVSGTDGATLWSNSTDPSVPVIPLTPEAGPAMEARGEALSATDSGGRAPTSGAVVVLGVLALAAIARRLRR